MPSAAQQELPKFFSLDKFEGLNRHDQRTAIGDQECAWLENFIPLGAGNLRTLYGEAAALYTAPGALTILNFFPFNIGNTFFHAVFLSDGSAVQVAEVGGATVSIAATNTFGSNVTAAQWGASGILIISSTGLYAWDGTLYPPGNATSPTWLNGGTATAMPTGLSGSSIEIFQNRAWIANAGKVSFSAPNNGADYSTANGGGTITSTDSFLRQAFIGIKQSNGFLYLLGDSSINVVSNVQTSGTPATTTFNNANVDPQTGLAWRDSLQSFGRALVLANPAGVYALYGGAAEKISDKLDSLFATMDLSLTPSSFTAILFGIKCYGLLFKTIDPFTGSVRALMALWNGRVWFLASQIATLTQVATRTKNSNLIAWGTDGTHLLSLFSAASGSLTKKFQSKLWAGSSAVMYKQALRVYLQAFDNSGLGMNVNLTSDSELTSVKSTFSGFGTIQFVNSSGGALQFQNSSLQNLNFTVQSLSIFGKDVVQNGRLLGLTLDSLSKDFTVVTSGIAYHDQTFYG